jgi:adenosylmethionine-8-amino-7-oxononanoate aminotransferase
VALASVELLLASPWKARVAAIAAQLEQELAPLRGTPRVADVRVLGAIGVVELHAPVDLRKMQAELVARGVWLRPFGRLLYTMPPFVIAPEDLSRVTAAMCEVVERGARAVPRGS